jgi:hypothetical protein
MKDVEFVSLLLLFLEQGTTSYSQIDLDLEFTKREDEWERRAEIAENFRQVIEGIALLTRDRRHGFEIARSRLRNQADFYSLFGAVYELLKESAMPAAEEACERLLRFLEAVGNQGVWSNDPNAASYYHAARSASNDPGPRRVRIDIMRGVLTA